LNRFLAPVLAGCLGLAVATAHADTIKIGFVNAQKILVDSPLAAKATKKLEAEFKQRDQELAKLNKDLQDAQAKFEKDSVTMKESDRRLEEKRLGDLNVTLQRKKREFGEDLNQRRNEEMAAILEKVNAVIKKYAQDEKFDLILQEAVYFSPHIDVTQKVIDRLGQ
jgi:outer membrane protein